jgi:hypothetical protein
MSRDTGSRRVPNPAAITAAGPVCAQCAIVTAAEVRSRGWSPRSEY